MAHRPADWQIGESADRRTGGLADRRIGGLAESLAIQNTYIETDNVLSIQQCFLL